MATAAPASVAISSQSDLKETARRWSRDREARTTAISSMINIQLELNVLILGASSLVLLFGPAGDRIQQPRVNNNKTGFSRFPRPAFGYRNIWD